MKSTGFAFFLLYFTSASLEIRAYHCSTPKLANGKIRIRNRSRFVKYSCNLGYILSGDKYSTCAHGKWDSPPPKCVRPGCRHVSPPSNGLIYPSHMNAVLHFYCKSGFELHGPNVTHCNGTSWSSNMPICLQTSTKPLLRCDFERADLCGWTHDLNHDFDWRRMKFNTPSGAIGTGPSYDHTYGADKGGFYMYIESSSRNENDTARLISPVYAKRENSNTCFEFYYHMFGTTIGTLRVYLKLVNETWASSPFFTMSRNQGNRWIGYIHLFETIPNDFQFIIEGVRGNGYVSDIAIDDVRIIDNCNLYMLQEQVSTTSTEFEISSTTEFFPDDFLSCEERCGRRAFAWNYRKCDCDENCIERNDCCPDFIYYCVLYDTTTGFAGIEDVTTDTETTLRTSTTLKLIETTKLSETITVSTVQPKVSHEIPSNEIPIEDVEHFKKKYNEKIIILNSEQSGNGSNFVLYTGVVSGLLLIGCVSVYTLVLMVRKRKIRNFSHGDSASDVRFLTNDELLDFNLVY